MYSHNPQDRVAIFIDGENIHYSAKHLNMRLDYLKLCSRLAGPRRLVRSYFYTAVSNQSEGKIDFINFLKLNGFTVVTKEIKSFNDMESGGRNVRSVLDMEMAMDVIDQSAQLESGSTPEGVRLGDPVAHGDLLVGAVDDQRGGGSNARLHGPQPLGRPTVRPTGLLVGQARPGRSAPLRPVRGKTNRNKKTCKYRKE